MQPQAAAGWKWWNALEKSATETGRRVLRVNCDETNIARCPKSGAGLVLGDLSRSRGPVLIAEDRHRKGSLSHLAFICDDAAVQPFLPQVLVGNEAVLRRTDLQELDGELPCNIYLVRQKSSWLDTTLFVCALKWLQQGLRRAKVSVEVLLLMDCSPVHCHEDVRRAAGRLGFSVCFVPRRLTWLLQPCDTHVFRKYKADLRRRTAEVQAAAGRGALPTVALLRCLLLSIRFVLQGHCWAQAFARNGYSGDGQASVSHRILRVLGEMPLASAVCGPVTAEDLALVLPARGGGRSVPNFLPRPRPIAMPAVRLPRRAPSEILAEAAADAFSEDNAAADWLRRLRPRRSRSGLESSPVADDAGHPPSSSSTNAPTTDSMLLPPPPAKAGRPTPGTGSREVGRAAS